MKIKSILQHGFLLSAASVLTFFLGGAILNSLVMPLLLQTGVEVETPEITEKTVNEARIILKRYGLNLLIEEERYHSNYPAGIVIHQIPEPGMAVKKGRNIRIIISKGTPRIKVPDLVEKSEREARNLLDANNLKIGDIFPVPSIEFPYPGVVIRQEPEANTVVEENHRINLYISSGKREVEIRMPDLVGMDLAAALDILYKLGFKNLDIQKEKDAEHLPNTILDQVPRPNIMATTTSEVILVVSEL